MRSIKLGRNTQRWAGKHKNGERYAMVEWDVLHGIDTWGEDEVLHVGWDVLGGIRYSRWDGVL